MKCITLWQPWASWIASGLKTIETRTHGRFKGLVGKRIGIHAGLKWDKMAIIEAKPYLKKQQIQRDKVHGVIICTALVTCHRKLKKSDSKYALIDCGNTERWGLFLEDIKLLKKPIYVSGKQGVWNYEEK